MTMEYILVKKNALSSVRDAKVMSGEVASHNTGCLLTWYGNKKNYGKEGLLDK